MDLVRVTPENIEQEHICCAIAGNSDIQVQSKKKWLLNRFSDGLVFLKGDVRGKCFLEYIPAENAWAPVQADGYMFINCFWVSGRYKGQGNANLLLEECIRDSKEKGKQGLCILSSLKKKPFLSDPAYLAHRGFQLADTAGQGFTLLYLPFTTDAPKPCFCPQVKTPAINKPGFVLYYSHQCPFTAKYVPLLQESAQKSGLPFKTVLIDTKEKAQSASVAATSFALFYEGEFITHEILSVAKFEKLAGTLRKSSGDAK